MSVEFVPAAVVRDLESRVAQARRQAEEPRAGGCDDPNKAEYWEELFEANAAAALAVLGRVQLPLGYVVRYRFFGRRGGDLLVRPFVARATTDVSTIRQLIDWHPPPDSVAPALRGRLSRDVEFLYRHFTFERSVAGYFEYWIAMQELWASARWVHSRVIADAAEFTAVAGSDDWQVNHPVERFEPAVVIEDGRTQLAVLLHCALDRQAITLHRIEIGADQEVQFVDAIAVAQGPRGYMM